MYSRKARTVWPILGLLVLAPISAEYLSGYLGQRLADLPGIVVSLAILLPPADDPTAKYATNVVQLVAVIALATWVIRRAERGVAA